MITFEHGMDIRARLPHKPTVARFRCSDGVYRYCIIGTPYGHLHTSAGTVRTWKTASGAYQVIKRYVPF